MTIPTQKLKDHSTSLRDELLSKRPATPTNALDEFTRTHSPSNAIELAIADHCAGPMTDWDFVAALNKAKDRVDSYPRLVEALRYALAHPGDQACQEAHGIKLLRELGESSK
jgi:hypothetical protein